MRVTLDFTDDKFTMHAEGVGSDTAQKMERAWHFATLTLLSEEGHVDELIHLDATGEISVEDGTEAPDPFSQAHDVDPTPEPEEDHVVEEYPKHEDGSFKSMSEHADEAKAQDA